MNSSSNSFVHGARGLDAVEAVPSRLIVRGQQGLDKRTRGAANLVNDCAHTPVERTKAHQLTNLHIWTEVQHNQQPRCPIKTSAWLVFDRENLAKSRRFGMKVSNVPKGAPIPLEGHAPPYVNHQETWYLSTSVSRLQQTVGIQR